MTKPSPGSGARRIAVALAVALLVVVGLLPSPASAAKPAATLSSITLNQAGPAVGDTVTFTVVLAQRAKNPVLIVDCYQSQVLVYEQRGGLADGYTLSWPSGAASCVANVYDIVTKNGVDWYMAQAVTTFSVVT